MQGAGEIDDQVRQSTDAELVGKTLDGDPTAYAELYDEEVAAMEALRELNADEDLDLKEGAEVLSGALLQERAALAKLQQALQES
jgi:hypothetical protein